MKDNLLRMNYLAFEKFDKAMKGVKYVITLGACLPIGILLINGMFFRTLGLIIGIAILIAMGMWVFDVGGDKE